MKLSTITMLSLLLSATLQAKTFKVGTMIPEGTNYANLLEEMGKEIKKATNKRVKFKFVWGGVAGDEPDVLRKIRVGQYHAGVFTAKTMADVYSDVRVMEIPFSFKDRAHSQKVLSEFRDDFEKGLAKNGFESLGIYETGEIYIVTKNKVDSMDGLKGQKLWLYQGDKLAEAFSKSLNLVAVPVALPDVLSSLSTGMIDASYAPALGIVALQWHSKVSYIVEPPFSYHFQGFLLRGKDWRKIRIDDQKAIKKITAEYQKKISDSNYQDGLTSFEAIKKQGVKVIQWPKKDIAGLNKVRSEVLKSLVDKKALSQDIVNKFNTKL
ncbi:TRAP transporter substrate-binding protein DctP [Pseudobacteriovorax antillogorgiicola]|uniref:TRAP-type C4-dicarboxylate transport system, substrate-binding protein n=1 Tax=Pseudobacteriovorax antillogorgiicola TaxID=1513793 RepID=A0A1Y6CE85_9BACT|nr:TRAP transporter substrate-binding protein DctP [Pseudobacteriovorax antillogorgiicola]TCS47667.1 TRAP-type C4-dicarboxylate transport system substrate-binding protein [Pseudobacteriovorax antillogorgiicola]SMF59664.1 TRAP-type C4-dicarboxylate transport system, substrate-binding protein [Pseudobacteriovorax antillogorgiicola]